VSEPSVIDVSAVGKRYVKYEDTPTLVGHALRLRSRTHRSALWALRGANLQVARGECVGIIGRNGSGKSTLLRMLAGVTAPTEGTVTVRGQVAPLIAVGVGFHPELTGRENVYVSGTILGLTRRQIDERFDEIIDFAEIEGFVDTPVKFFSSGMYVRLGFAVSVLADPDVLLVDEVLAVGDLAFQMKCFDRMQAVRETGTTIVVVSHNLNAIRRLCDRSAVLHAGEMRFDGGTRDAIALFHELLGESREIEGDTGRDVFRSTGAARLSRFTLGTVRDGEVQSTVPAGALARFSADLESRIDIESPYLALHVFHESGVQVYGETVAVEGSLRAGDRHHVEVDLPVELPRGSYSAELLLVGLDATLHAPPPAPILFYVDGRNGVRGVADLHASFKIRPR
jgi:ABC-type polysaccharide/polyol phosphate transport system ATPase subunit